MRGMRARTVPYLGFPMERMHGLHACAPKGSRQSPQVHLWTETQGTACQNGYPFVDSLSTLLGHDSPNQLNPKPVVMTPKGTKDKSMKHIFQTSEIAHKWAHQTQSDARNSAGNFFFHGDTIYSYGSHFPIARHVQNAQGGKAILFTHRGYSLTTSRHIHLVRSAIPYEVRTLTVTDPTAGVGLQIQDFGERIERAQHECFGDSGRFRPKAYRTLELLIQDANDVTEFFGSAQRWKLPESTDAIKQAIAEENARRAREEKRLERKRKREHAQYLKIKGELLERWIKGDTTVHTWDIPRDFPVRLRIAGNDIETSMGVRFPIAHAIRGIRFIRSIVAAGQGYKRNGHTFRLGAYAIDEIDTDGNVTAGCHHVEYAEAERIAGLIGA